MYADDLKVYRTVEAPEDCLKLQEDLDRLLEYCSANSLFLNLEKCISITFSKNIDLVNFNYNIDSKILKKVEQIKDLGVLLDSKWSFRFHFDKIVAEANKMLGFIVRSCQVFKDPKTFLSLYFAFVYSKLSFASAIWNPNYKIHINRIETIQNKFLKVLAYKAASTPESVARKFKILSLAERRNISELCTIFKLINHQIDSPLLLSYLNFNVPARELRSQELFNIPFRKTNLGRNTPLIRMQMTCNRYCNDIVMFSATIVQFKTKLKRLFLTNVPIC